MHSGGRSDSLSALKACMVLQEKTDRYFINEFIPLALSTLHGHFGTSITSVTLPRDVDKVNSVLNV